MRYGIAINAARCMGCYACFMACKDEHCGWNTAVSASQPEMGQFWINIKEWERGDSERRVKVASVPTICNHCENPLCANVAENGAVYKREDGIVIVDPVKAKGQKQIAEACPLHAIFWNEELQLPQKCTMCAHLLDDPEYPGYEPRCVEACPNEALVFGDLDDPNSKVSRMIAQNKVTPLEEIGTQNASVVYLNVPGKFLAGTVYYPEEMDEVCIGASISLFDKEGDLVSTTTTNMFGDWEFENLPKNQEFDIRIEKEGYQKVNYHVLTDFDHYVAMTYLVKQI